MPVIQSRQALMKTPLRLLGNQHRRPPPMELVTGGGDDGGVERQILLWRQDREADKKKLNLTGDLQEGILIKNIKECWKLADKCEGSLDKASLQKLLQLEPQLLQAATKRDALHTIILYKKLFQKKLILNTFTYRTALRLISMKHQLAGLSKKEVTTHLLNISSSMIDVFEKSPIPYLGTVLPLYIKVCVGLGLPKALRGARQGLMKLDFPVPTAENQEKPTPVGETLESFATEMYLLARAWDRKSSVKQTVRIITKHHGKRAITKRRYSSYHVQVVENLQFYIFDVLEARTAAYLPYLSESEACEVLVGSEEQQMLEAGMSWLSEAEPSVKRSGCYRRLFKRKIRLPKLKDV
eukprot:TRINITY_DN2825_c0_g1_i1.p1 TRINITY_DN2825_c0_g1~~TRINITY_DN2825_c0_g1_i1.p1  ORF type:complete len:370 (+),score=49.27 TRINITY_DN2825_c0_g1_i1:52-1110(+)